MGNPTDPRTKEAIEFIESVTGEKFPSSDFQTSLKNGVLLCKTINILKPGTVPKYNTSKMPFKEMENVDAYLKACMNLNVPSQYLFMTVDLYEGKNLNQVVQNVISLKRQFGYGFEKQHPVGSGSSPAIEKQDQSEIHQQPHLRPEEPVPDGQGWRAGFKDITADQLAPFCASCNSRISSSYVNACSLAWHHNCFLCKKCGRNLKSIKYYEDEPGKPLCETCTISLKPAVVNVATKDMGFSFDY